MAASLAAALAAALAAPQGLVRGYAGVRVNAAGRRFRIEDATLWCMRAPSNPGVDGGQQGKLLGQAAVFRTFSWVDPPKAGELGEAGERWQFAGGPEGRLEPVPVAAELPPPAEAEPARASDPAVREASLGALRAGVEAQAEVVRQLKASGLTKADAALADAVGVLLSLKAELAAAEA